MSLHYDTLALTYVCAYAYRASWGYSYCSLSSIISRDSLFDPMVLSTPVVLPMGDLYLGQLASGKGQHKCLSSNRHTEG